MGNVTNAKKWSARERLLFIEKVAYWRGWIRRADICTQFNVSTPQASADLSEYQRLNPSSLEYDGSRKCYVAKVDMELRLGETEFEDGLSLLQGPDRAGLPDSVARVDLPRHHVPDRPTRELVRAVLSKSAIEIYYFSVHSGTERWRRIVPHAFGHDGYRWHVRAWCFERSAHQDFVLGRISRTRTSIAPTQSVPPDHDWNSWITIQFRPHRGLNSVQQTAIARDFGMKSGAGRLRVRRAMLHYTLLYLGMHKGPAELQRRLELVRPVES